jgi:hypothetical protein
VVMRLSGFLSSLFHSFTILLHVNRQNSPKVSHRRKEWLKKRKKGEGVFLVDGLRIRWSLVVFVD